MTLFKRISLLLSVLTACAALWILNHPGREETVASLRSTVAKLDAENRELSARVEALAVESQSLAAERQALSVERQALSVERQAFSRERQTWNARMDAPQGKAPGLPSEASGQPRGGGPLSEKTHPAAGALAATNGVPETETPFATAVLALASRAAELNRHFAGMPGREIPELQFLDEGDWLHLAKEAHLDSPEGVRKALADARQQAKARFAHMLTDALTSYFKANNAQPPISMEQLKPYFSAPVDDATLARYHINTDPTGKQKFGSSTVINEAAAVDPQFDSQFEIGLSGWSSATVRDTYSESIR